MTRRWLRRALWAAGFGCLWLPVCDDPPLRTEAYLVDVGSERATIGLITPAPRAVAATVRDAAGREVAVVPAGDSVRRHWFPVGGLTSGSAYDYELRASDGEVWGGRIRTAPGTDAAPVRFAFLGDSGDQPWWVWLQRAPLWYWPSRWGWFADSTAVTQVGAAVAAAQPDFLLHLGDVIYPKGLHAHYRSGFFRPFAGVLREAPCYALLGNHDVMDAGGVQLLANLRGPMAAGVAGPVGDGRNLSFAWGAVRIVLIDCNTDYTGDRFGPGHPSYEFLHHELPRCSEPWLVVASHFPMRSQSRQGDRGDLLLSLLPELEQLGVDLYLSGHDHCYQRFGQPGEKGPVLVVSGGGGKDLYDVAPARHGVQAAKIAKAYHWCSAEASGGRLTVVARGVDGHEIDRFELALPTGEKLQRLAQRSPERARRVAALTR